MIIIHLITRLYKGGAEENTLLSCLAQAQAGHEVILLFGPDCSRPDAYERYQKEVKFYQLKFMKHPICLFYDVMGLFELIRYFLKVKPDIVHTHNSKAGILGRLAAFIARVPHIIHGVHIIPFNNVGFLAKGLYVSVEIFCAMFTDLFIHVSQGTLEAFKRAKIGKHKKHCVVYSGMNIQKFINPIAPDNANEILNVSAGLPKPKVILMLAALEARKQHLAFLDGFAIATKKGQNIRLLLAGEGELRTEIFNKIHKLDLQDRVVMLGHSPTPEKFVALADVGVLASLREGLPRVVVQYLAGGCSAVVSDIDGIEEIISNNENGIIVRSSKAGDVAKSAVELIMDDKKLNRLKIGACSTDVSLWSHEEMIISLNKAYMLLGGKVVDQYG